MDMDEAFQHFVHSVVRAIDEFFHGILACETS
jgi:hypothetical protein